ncbi:hypothetical protein OROMI_009352 [Orobanche minor]
MGYIFRFQRGTSDLPHLNLSSGFGSLWVFGSGHPNGSEIVLSNMAVVLDRIFLDVLDPFQFEPYHKAIREPFDYYMFGQKYIHPLLDFRTSFLGNMSLFDEIEKKLEQGENVILISNHQTEADPAVLALLLESNNPIIAENMGLLEMVVLLRGGAKIIWIAPSGGRDRPHPVTKEWYPAPFDASSVDNMRRLAEHAGTPGHVYPLAILCHEIMPPPPQVEKEIGERRVISFHGVGLSVAPSINYHEFTSALEDQEK